MITVKQRPYLYNWTGNSVYYELYSAAAAADDSISFEVRVFFKNSAETDYEQVITLPFVPLSGSVKFNLQDILHAHLEFLMPDIFDDATIIDMTRQSGTFYIDFREISAISTNPPWDSSETEYFRHIIKGGIHAFRFKGNNYWLNYFPDNQPFLTWQQSGRLAHKRERMYLAWYCTKTAASPNLVARITAYFTDGSNNSADKPVPGDLLHVYLIPAGYFQQDLDTLGPGKKTWYWTVQMLDITDPGAPVALSEIFKYQVDNRSDYNDVTLHYRNSLGGIDSVRIRGVIETNLNYDITETSGLLDSDYFMKDQLPALNSVYKAKETVVFKGDIGHLGKEEQDRLRDAFLNRQCFQVRLGKWWPVKLLNSNTRLRTSNDKRFSMPIEWQYADGGSSFYTPDLDLGEGESTTNVCGCEITGLTADVSFNGDNTIAYITFNYGVLCPDGESIAAVEYKIDAGDWQEMVYPYVVPLQVNHAVGTFGTANFRVKCNERESGPVSQVSFDTRVAAPPPDPETDNSTITNRLGQAQTLFLQINGVTVFSAFFAIGETKTFNLPSTYTDALVRVVCGTSTPSSSYAIIDGVTYPADGFPPKRADWGSLDIPASGIDIYV